MLYTLVWTPRREQTSAQRTPTTPPSSSYLQRIAKRRVFRLTIDPHARAVVNAVSLLNDCGESASPPIQALLIREPVAARAPPRRVDEPLGWTTGPLEHKVFAYGGASRRPGCAC